MGAINQKSGIITITTTTTTQKNCLAEEINFLLLDFRFEAKQQLGRYFNNRTISRELWLYYLFLSLSFCLFVQKCMAAMFFLRGFNKYDKNKSENT